MRITITCEECGRRHPLAREAFEPGPIWVVCHGCETPLQAVLSGEPEPVTAAAPELRTPFGAVWAGTLDIGLTTR
jgi:hypothetical protein